MDELELLKKDWQKDSDEFKTYSEKEIYGMIKSKSISITKTLLIFGIIEVACWQILEYLDNNFSFKELSNFMIVRIFQFAFFISLIFYFYYKINNSENSKKLMKSILNLRKVIYFYIFFIFLGAVYYFISNYDDIAKSAVAGFIDGWNGNAYRHTKINEIKISFEKVLSIVITSAIILLLILTSIYYLTYGRLLKKLKSNYQELSKLEESKA